MSATCFSSSRSDHRERPAGGCEHASAISLASTSPVTGEGTGGNSRSFRPIVAQASPSVPANRFETKRTVSPETPTRSAITARGSTPTLRSLAAVRWGSAGRSRASAAVVPGQARRSSRLWRPTAGRAGAPGRKRQIRPGRPGPGDLLDLPPRVPAHTLKRRRRLSDTALALGTDHSEYANATVPFSWPGRRRYS